MSGTVYLVDLFNIVLDTSNCNQRVRRARDILLNGISHAKMNLVWEHMCKIIAINLKSAKGIAVPGFGKFLPGSNCLLLCDNFIRSYNVNTMGKPHSQNAGPCIDINFTRLSLATRVVTKDEVKAIISELIGALGELIRGNNAPVMIEFGEVGILTADHRKVDFHVGAKKVKNRESAPAFSREYNTGLDLEINTTVAPLEEQEIVIIPKLRLKTSTEKQPILFQSREAEEETMVPIVYPVFLNPESNDNKPYAKAVRLTAEERVRQRSRNLEKHLEKAYDSQESLADDVMGLLLKQDQEIARRHELSEMAYKQRLLDKKKAQLDMNTFLMGQAKARQDREGKEREYRNEASVMIDEHGPKAFPVEADIDFDFVNRRKKQLHKSLKDQMKDKDRDSKEARVRAIAEERFLTDCSIKLMQMQREQERERKAEEKQILYSNWARQNKLSNVQKVLVEAKNGKVLTTTASEVLI